MDTSRVDILLGPRRRLRKVTEGYLTVSFCNRTRCNSFRDSSSLHFGTQVATARQEDPTVAVRLTSTAEVLAVWQRCVATDVIRQATAEVSSANPDLL